jgi:hypothetical protein
MVNLLKDKVNKKQMKDKVNKNNTYSHMVAPRGEKVLTLIIFENQSFSRSINLTIPHEYLHYYQWQPNSNLN